MSSFFSPRSGFAARFAKTPSLEELIVRPEPELGPLNEGRIVGLRCMAGVRCSPDDCDPLPAPDDEALAVVVLLSATGWGSG